MDIIIVFLAAALVVGFYIATRDAPINRDMDPVRMMEAADMKSAMQCVISAHARFIDDASAAPACAPVFGVESVSVCSDARRRMFVCTDADSDKIVYQITKTTEQFPEKTNIAAAILSRDFADFSGVGIFVRGKIIGNATTVIPADAAKIANLADWQIAYATKYNPRRQSAPARRQNAQPMPDCGFSERPVFRGQRWECVAENENDYCAGDTYFDADLMTCVPSERNKPFCAPGFVASIVDDFWDCVIPETAVKCAPGATPRFDATAAVWACDAAIAEYSAAETCRARIAANGGTVAARITSCTDCETQITNPDTCETFCIPGAARATDPACYARECTGYNRALYFGFPENTAYVAAARTYVPALENAAIRLDAAHSRNRKFNCLDCGARAAVSGTAPFTASCQ